jgi:uncharacterized protein YqeY
MEMNSVIFEKIQSRIKVAMLTKDTVARDCLRTIVSDIKNQTVNADPQKEITDSVCLKVLEKSAKTHKDSISQFSSAGREDLEQKERSELAIIETFLPKPLTEDETRDFVTKFMRDNGIEPVKKNMGLIMKSLPNVPGLDRKLVAGILGKVLS